MILKPGNTTTIFEQKTGGRIAGIELTPQVELNSNFKDLILSAVWDDEKASINCPVSDFFGYAFGKPSMQSMIAGVRDGVHYCYFPMPYDKYFNCQPTRYSYRTREGKLLSIQDIS